MKKLSFIISLLMIAAMLLAACGGSDADENQTPGSEMTPGAAVTEAVPGTGSSTDLTTPTVAEATNTPEAAATKESTPTTAAGAGEATPTTSTGAAESTPQAGVPVTGNECNPTRVEKLLDFAVADAQGNKLGEVGAVVMLRDTSAMPVTSSAAGSTAATPTTDAGAAASASAGSQAAPKVAYLIVDVENSNNRVAVPFSAFAYKANSAAAGSAKTAGSDKAAATPTTAAGADNAAGTPTVEGAQQPADKVSTDECVLTLNVKQDVLAKAPAFESDNLDFTAKDWDKAFTSYWTQQGGLSIPQTGSAKLAAPVLVENQVSIDARNVNGDDLGEVDEFVIDQKTGDVKYAVMAAGGFLGIGEKYILVPVSALQWVTKEGADAKDPGYFILNTTKEDLSKAPSFDDLDKLDTTKEGWDTELNTFWNNLTGDKSAQPMATPTVSK